MPFTFIEIESRKNKTIPALFIFLVGFYFLGFYILAALIRGYFFLSAFVSGRGFFYFTVEEFVYILLASLAAAGLQWYFTAYAMVDRLIETMEASVPDKQDSYHQMFSNVVEEVGVATGGRNIEAVVLPTVALNAFSVSDFNGRCCIGVTEGLLARLNRAQLEAVVGHEAAHIVAGDTLIKTVSVSLFGIYGAILRGCAKSFEQSGVSGKRGGGHPLIILIYAVSLILYGICKLVSMFISRECEYRADATAVRLVRDPLSLAQALYTIGRKWRGGGMGYEYLESLFISNPNYSALDEEETVIADLFSTHPPLRKRIQALTGMVHIDEGVLEREIDKARKPRSPLQEAPPLIPETLWYAIHNGQWQGPYPAAELLQLPWLVQDTFIRKEGSQKTALLYEEREILDAAAVDGGSSTDMPCPRCRQALHRVTYEGAPVYHCALCKGYLTPQEKMPAIIMRQDQGYSDNLIRQAAKLQEMLARGRFPDKLKVIYELPCPKCAVKMMRSFYNLAYPVEVDKCMRCNLIWFDRDELELLQYLIEKVTGQIV